MKKIVIKPISVLKSERKEIEDDQWGDVLSIAELDAHDFKSGSYVYIIFEMDKVNLEKIEIAARYPRNNRSLPLLGIFAQRGKNRPNRLGISCPKIQYADADRLVLSALDAIDETPILSVFPFDLKNAPKKIREPDWLAEIMKNYFSNSPRSGVIKHLDERIMLMKKNSSSSLLTNSTTLLSLGTCISEQEKTLVHLCEKILSPECTMGLLDNFSHIYCLYFSKGKVNFCIAELLSVNQYDLILKNANIPDGSDILDIKPYTRHFLPHLTM